MLVEGHFTGTQLTLGSMTLLNSGSLNIRSFLAEFDPALQVVNAWVLPAGLQAGEVTVDGEGIYTAGLVQYGAATCGSTSIANKSGFIARTEADGGCEPIAVFEAASQSLSPPVISSFIRSDGGMVAALTYLQGVSVGGATYSSGTPSTAGLVVGMDSAGIVDWVDEVTPAQFGVTKLLLTETASGRLFTALRSVRSAVTIDGTAVASYTDRDSCIVAELDPKNGQTLWSTSWAGASTSGVTGPSWGQSLASFSDDAVVLGARATAGGIVVGRPVGTSANGSSALLMISP